MQKTKLVALLLAVAMVVSLVPGVSAAAVGCPAHTDVTTWTEVAADTWTGGAIADGHYKLTGDQTLASALTVAGNVCIDLAGYNITVVSAKDNTHRAFEVTGVLTITDSAEEDGVISGGHMEMTSTNVAADVKVYGGNVLVSGAGAKLNLYGGTISGGYMKASTYKYHTYGGNIGLVEGAELNIYGGAIKDGKIEMPQQATQYHGGGNIYADASTVNIYGGTVSGGDVIAKYSSGSKDARKAYGVGGNIAVVDGTFYMEGGLVDDGNLEVSCSATKADAAVNATTEAWGGNVYCGKSDGGAGTTVTIIGGVISNGTLSGVATSKGGGTVTQNAHGGNLYVNGTAEIKGNAQILGGEILSNTTTSRGGNLYITSSAVVTLSENAVLSGGICVTDNARGGNAFVVGTLNINGGTISDGAAGWGANLMLQSGATINLNAGAITGGTGDASVVVQRGTLNVNGGSIENPEGKFVALSVQGTIDTNGGTANINAGVVGDVFANRAAKVNVNAGVVGATELSHTATLTVKAGATVTKMWKAAATATVSVEEGIICRFNPALNEVEGFEAYLMDKSTGTTTYTVYEKLATALEAAKAGNTVTLMADVTADAVVVPANVTLNLYGRTLKAATVTANFEGAQIKDSKMGASGVGKLVADSVALPNDNAFLPLVANGEYSFEEVVFAQKQDIAGTKGTYKTYITSEAAATLIDDAILAGNTVTIEVKATWTDANGGAHEKTFVLSQDLAAEYAAGWDSKMIVLTMPNLTGISNLVCTAQITANGVTVTA